MIGYSLALGMIFSLLTAWPSIGASVLPTTWASPGQPVYIGDTQQPALAVSADGSKATAVWVASNGTCNNIKTASATISGNTATWGTAVTLTSCVAGQDAETPSIALSSDGTTAVAAWGHQQPGGTSADVRSKSATINGNQGNWDPDPNNYTLIQDAGGIGPRPDVAVSADGTTAVLSWATNTGPGRPTSIATKFARIDGSHSVWESDAQYVSGDGSLASDSWSNIALSADGNTAITIFGQNAGSHWGIYSAAATATAGATPNDPPQASWAAEQKLSGINGRFPQDASIELSSDGSKATGAWQLSGSGQALIQTASATLTGNSANWESSPHDLVTSNFSTSSPRLGLSADGKNATMVWSRDTGNFPQNPLIESASAAISGKNGDWSSAQTLTGAGSFGADPTVGVSADGSQATAVWIDRANNKIIGNSANIDGREATWGTVTNEVGSTDGTYTPPGIGVSADGSRATAVFAGDSNGSLLSSSAIRTYTLAFNANGGQGAMSNLTANSATQLPANKFVRSGYKFAGWNTKANGSGTAYANEATYSFRSGGTLYAQWTAVSSVKNQIPVKKCVRDTALPREKAKGTRVLTTAGCKTNAGQKVGTQITVRNTKGEVRGPALACRYRGKFRATQSTGYADHTRYCQRGNLVVRTFGMKAKITVSWSAPAKVGYKKYWSTRTYRA